MSSNHFNKIAEIENTLNQLGLTIFKHGYDYACYGSWSLEIGSEKQRAHISWDGRDLALAIGMAELKNSNDYLNWTPSYEPFDNWNILEEITRDPYKSAVVIANYIKTQLQ